MKMPDTTVKIRQDLSNGFKFVVFQNLDKTMKVGNNEFIH